ncbi:haloacid dehalogenase-like hydrolase [Leptospira inadai serovar Lyme str. 10]|uniref:Haloacid dehalogenase-like hydrolase n=2 Tax=Leptospira inadai serovar Lyme TaxID=293084 RepID=V6HV60_9LEPT|nr:haloacid dehalogenase-like hydrolase [Leptospira inadai]EQA36704.1 haloacid dehalogenase-like hydrolase [Leptospira inadai serovar Lyme str. 10]PNV75604.1 haloacid dehalogenase-like hydrolase [Leptospira inadai serovar Lyme]
MLSDVWDPDIRSGLEGMISGPAGLACFDFDNTLIRGDLGVATMQYILMNGLIRADLDEFWEELRDPFLSLETISVWKDLWRAFRMHKDTRSYGRLVEELFGLFFAVSKEEGPEAAYRWTRIIYSGMSEEELKKIARYVFVENQKQNGNDFNLTGGYSIDIRLRIRKPLLELIRLLKERDWEVWIITASPEYCVQVAAQEFGLEQSRVRGMRLKSRQGVMLPEIEEPLTFNDGKVKAIREITSSEIGFAAGDAFTDLSMLLAANRSLLIDHGDSDLRSVGESAGWWIQSADSIDSGSQVE